jgi:hypothetical protein
MGASSWETRLRSGYGPDCRNPEVVVAITGRVIHNANGLHQVARRGGGCRGRTFESSSWAVSGYSEPLSVCVVGYRENIPQPLVVLLWSKPCMHSSSLGVWDITLTLGRVVDFTVVFVWLMVFLSFYLQMWIFQLIPRLRLSSPDFDAIPDLNHVKTSRLLGRREPNGNTLVGSTSFQ